MATSDPRDLGIAVQNALRVDDCHKELWEGLANGRRLGGDEKYHTRQFSSNDGGIITRDLVAEHYWNSKYVAAGLMNEAAVNKKLPIWLRLHEGEALADASAFADVDRRTWTVGLFRTYSVHKTFLEGRPLWVKQGDWSRLLSEALAARGSLPSNDDKGNDKPVSAPRTDVEYPWTEATMKAAIALCDVGNREKAWRDRFKSREDEHGWSNDAFRLLWPDARGTRGMTGRPAKRS